MQRAQLDKEPSENPFKGRPIASYHDIVAMIRRVNAEARARPGPTGSRFYSTRRPEDSDLESCDGKKCDAETCTSDRVPAEQSQSQSNEVQAAAEKSSEPLLEPDQECPTRAATLEL